MIVIPPIDILNSATILNSSSIAAGSGSDPAAWNSATNYSLGTRVRVDADKKIYENIIAGVDATSPGSAPTRWAFVSYMNRYAMFDGVRDNVSTSTSDITLVFKPGERIDSIAILGISNVTSIRIWVQDLGEVTTYLDQTTTITTEGSLINFTLPPIKTPTIKVYINGTGTRTVGEIVLGTHKFIGTVQSNNTLDTLNFSIVDRDTFGYANLKTKRSVPKINCQLLVEAAYVPIVVQARTDLNATPAVWIALEDNPVPQYYDPMIILGIYKQFSITFDSSIHATITLELEEI